MAIYLMGLMSGAHAVLMLAQLGKPVAPAMQSDYIIVVMLWLRPLIQPL